MRSAPRFTEVTSLQRVTSTREVSAFRKRINDCEENDASSFAIEPVAKSIRSGGLVNPINSAFETIIGT